jgi:hypothetical protein
MSPDHPTHRIVKKLLLNDGSMDVDKLIDDPVRFLGKGHRKFFHNSKDVLLLAAFSKDPARFVEHAMTHIYTDRLFTMRRQIMNKAKMRASI